MAENFSFADSLSNKDSFISLDVPDIIFPLPLNRELYKSDQNCSGCKRKFNVPGLSNSIKNICQFCYRGVCARCLQFEYFHSETGSIEQMCSNCNYTIVSLGSRQEILIQKCRLQRAELKKGIQSAIKQKEQFSLERKIVQKKISDRKTLENEDFKFLAELEKLKMKEKELKMRAECADQKKSEILFKKKLLSKKYLSNLNALETIKKAKEFQFEEIEEMREKLNDFYYKIAKGGNLFGNNERIIELELEIDDLQGKILDKSEILRNTIEVIEELKVDFCKNTEKIAILDAKSKDLNKITEDEQMVLDIMVSQISELDDLVRMNQEILRSSEKLEEETELKSTSMIETQESEVELSLQQKENFSKQEKKNLTTLTKNVKQNTKKGVNEQKGCNCSVM